MILRAAFALCLVLVVAQHQPDIGLGRPTAAIPFAETGDVARCNQNEIWLCGELQIAARLDEQFVSAANRVRDDLKTQHARRQLGATAF